MLCPLRIDCHRRPPELIDQRADHHARSGWQQTVDDRRRLLIGQPLGPLDQRPHSRHVNLTGNEAPDRVAESARTDRSRTDTPAARAAATTPARPATPRTRTLPVRPAALRPRQTRGPAGPSRPTPHRTPPAAGTTAIRRGQHHHTVVARYRLDRNLVEQFGQQRTRRHLSQLRWHFHRLRLRVLDRLTAAIAARHIIRRLARPTGTEHHHGDTPTSAKEQQGTEHRRPGTELRTIAVRATN